MVSPHKKKKLEKPTNRVSGPRGEQSSVKTPLSRKARAASTKPLSDKKFYLDIRNHATLKKIETKLTTLGARLELFLVKDVNYVVTDREDYHPPGRGTTASTPNPSPFCSISPATTDSPTDGVISFKARSRAETMIERVKQQPQKTTGDILDNAIAWKIPIYPLPRFLTWLTKVGKRIEKLTGDSGVLIGRGIRELKGSFLKLETNTKPEFRQFSSWPTLGLVNPKNNRNGNELQRMTRKVNRTVKEASSAPGGGNGYCEMCRVHYDQLDSHITTAQHSKLVTDPVQYSTLDSVIAQNNLNLGVGSLRKSLRIAKSPPPCQVMGGKQSSEVGLSSLVTPPQCSSIPTSALCISAFTSPKLNGHVTRSVAAKGVAALQPRVNLGTPVPLTGVTAVPLPGVTCNGIELRSKRISKDIKSSPTFLDSLNDEKLGRTRKQSTPPSGTPYRQVATSPPPAISPLVVVEHNLRSRRCQVSLPSPVLEPTQTEKQPLSARSIGIKASISSKPSPPSTRLRGRSPPAANPTSSEKLSSKSNSGLKSPPAKLSSILKPHGSRPTPSLRATAIARTPSVHKPNKSHRPSQSSLPPPPPPTAAQPPKKHRKRLSCEEKFIEDNKSYYKVEVLNSKLRSTEYFIAQKQVEERANGHNTRVSTPISKPIEEVKPVVVRFKKVRKSELAVLSDEAENFMFGNPKKEIEDAATSDSSEGGDEEDNDADEDYEQDEEESDSEEETLRRKKKGKLEIIKDKTKDETSDSKLKDNELKIKEETMEEFSEGAPSEEKKEKVEFSFEMKPCEELWMKTYKRQEEGNEIYIPQSHSYPDVVLPYEVPPPRRRYKRRDRLKVPPNNPQSLVPMHVIDDKPRKSPRCHASTLAIMSSLLSRRRPLRECSDKPVSYEEESSLTETVESSGSGSSVMRCRVADMIASACADTKGDAIAEALLNGAKRIDLEPGACLEVDPKCIEEAQDPLTRETGLDIPFDCLISTHNNDFVEDVFPTHLRYFDGIRYSNFDSCASSECSDFFGFEDGRVSTGKKRKRKRNLTGWPNGTKPKRKPNRQIVSMTDPSIDVMTTPNTQLVTPKRKRGRPPLYPQSPLLPTSPYMPTTPQTLPINVDRKSEDEPFPRKRKLSRFFPNRFK